MGIGLELTDGTRLTTKGRIPEVGYKNGVFAMKYPGSKKEPEFVWLAKQEEHEALSVRLHIKNTTEKSLPVEKLVVFSTFVPGEIHASMTGYETASPAHPPLPLSQHERLVESSRKTPSRVGPITPSEDRLDLPWMTQVVDGQGKHTLLGFTTAKEQAGFISLEQQYQGYALTAFNVREGITLDPGEKLSSERLLISFEQNPVTARDHYANESAKLMRAKVFKESVSGGISWYWRGEEGGWGWKVHEGDIKRYVDRLTTMRDTIPIDHLILDDMYDPQGKIRNGDWPEDREKFPSGLQGIVDYVHAKGLNMHLWDSPFSASSESQVYKKHPEWFVRGTDGKPLVVKEHWGGAVHALDLTHPKAQEHLRKRMQRIKEIGFDGIKIDFLFLGAARGERFDRKATGIMALRKGLHIIAEEMQDRQVLHCGAPMLPIVGYASLARVAPDSAPYWVDSEREGTQSSLKHKMRSLGARSWMDAWYRKDPDCFIARKDGSQLTEAERESELTLTAMTGVHFLGDDVSMLEKEQVALVSRIFPPLGTGERAVPLAYDAEGMPTRMKMEIQRPWEKWTIAAMFNPGDTEAECVFEPQEWGLDPQKKYHLFEQWEGRYVGAVNDIPPHGVKVLSVHEDKGRPQLVGSTMHVLGNAVGIEDEKWEDNHLNIVLRGGKEGTLAIYVPDEYKQDGEENITIVEVNKEMKSISLPFVKSYRHCEP